MKRIVLILGLMPLFSKAQNLPYRDCNAEITHLVHSRLDSMASKNFTASRISGYRILLYSGNDRSEAGKAKEKAYILYPKGDVYTTYSAPTFKVRFGNFYSRLEAWQLLKKIQVHFPQAVITPEVVLVKP
jgi:hypothetical protein